MATCPRCMGALTENHRCPRGIGTRVTEAVSTVGIGGVLGALFCFVIEERPAGALVVAAAALGAVLAAAVNTAAGGKSSSSTTRPGARGPSFAPTRAYYS